MAEGQAAQLTALADKQRSLEERVRELEAEKSDAHERLRDLKRRTRQYEAEVALSAQTQNALHRETRTLHKSFELIRESNKAADEEIAHLREQLEGETREAVRVEQEAAALEAERAGERELMGKLKTLLKRMREEQSRQNAELEDCGAQTKQGRLQLRQVKERLNRKVSEQHKVAEKVRQNMEVVSGAGTSAADR